MEVLTTLEKIICQCGIVICPFLMIWIINDIRKQLKDMRSFGEEIFGETKDFEEVKSINDIPECTRDGIAKKEG